jgi:hypothetical protein
LTVPVDGLSEKRDDLGSYRAGRGSALRHISPCGTSQEKGN